MKIYFNKDLTIKSIDKENAFVKGNNLFNSVTVYMPTTDFNSYTDGIYPTFSFERADHRRLGPLSGTSGSETVSSVAYTKYTYTLSSDVVKVPGELQISINWIIGSTGSQRSVSGQITATVVKSAYGGDDSNILILNSDLDEITTNFNNQITALNTSLASKYSNDGGSDLIANTIKPSSSSNDLEIKTLADGKGVKVNDTLFYKVDTIAEASDLMSSAPEGRMFIDVKVDANNKSSYFVNTYKLSGNLIQDVETAHATSTSQVYANKLVKRRFKSNGTWGDWIEGYDMANMIMVPSGTAITTAIAGVIAPGIYQVYSPGASGHIMFVLKDGDKIEQMLLDGTSENFIQVWFREWIPGTDSVPDLTSKKIAQASLTEVIANKVTSMSSTSTDIQYPSAKAVYDAIVSAISNIANASSSSAGHMSPQDKANLDTLMLLLGESSGDADATVNTIREVLAIFDSYSEGTSVANALSGKENTSNKLKSTDIYTDSDTKYPTAKAVTDNFVMKERIVAQTSDSNANKTMYVASTKFVQSLLAEFDYSDTTNTKVEKLANKVTSISASSDNSHYPGAKAVYDFVGQIADHIVVHPDSNGEETLTDYLNSLISTNGYASKEMYLYYNTEDNHTYLIIFGNCSGNCTVITEAGEILKYVLTGEGNTATWTITKPFQKAYSSTTLTIAAADWDATAKTVSKSVSGVTTTNLVQVSPNPSSVGDYATAGAYCSAQASGSLTFACETIPTSSISVEVVVWP